MASSSYDRTFSIFDYFRGRGGETNTPGDNSSSFTFIEQGYRTIAGESVTVDNLLEETTVLTCINAIVQGVTQAVSYTHLTLPTIYSV